MIQVISRDYTPKIIPEVLIYIPKNTTMFDVYKAVQTTPGSGYKTIMDYSLVFRYEE